MGRLRVLSFISNRRGPKNISSPPTPPSDSDYTVTTAPNGFHASPPEEVPAPLSQDAPSTLKKPDRASSRPVSTLLYQQQLLPTDVVENPLPELEPIFSYLNSQSGKLYYEGYFFKLNDLDNYGRPCQDRKWTEHFAQLVGTVISLWDPAALDAADPDVDVIPTFINLADASIKMIESLPTRNQDSTPLQNVLSISTAGKNRYLLHFNSLNALTQWTAAIRLTMFENTLLQESYTGALIAGKGKTLNGIKTILEKTTFKYEDWVRVRFGPGTPWRRCWCVVSQADEKDVQKHRKMQKKKSTYERPFTPPKGNIKFYTSKKTKKIKPVATITDAFSAFAIYPQSRSLVDQSTLVKVEGHIIIHSEPETVAEGFVFVLPELHAAVSGFETMLRWLFPVFDAFQLYGRPARLLADTVSTQSLMFAMPASRRNSYLDTLDVAALIHTDGSRAWNERDWRKQMKDATSRRMTSTSASRVSSISRKRGLTRGSLSSQSGIPVRFDGVNGQSIGRRLLNNHSSDALSMPPQRNSQQNHLSKSHNRTTSEISSATAYRNGYNPDAQPPFDTRLLEEADEAAPPPPPHGDSQRADTPGDRSSSDGETKADHPTERQEIRDALKPSPLPLEVTVPPAFSHDPKDMPHIQPQMSPELRRAGSRISSGTLSQMAEAQKLHELENDEDTKRQNRPFDLQGGSNIHSDTNAEKAAFDGNTQFPRPVPADASSSLYSSPVSPVNPALDGIPFNSAPDGSINANFSPLTPQQSPKKPPYLEMSPQIHRKPAPQLQNGSESHSLKTASSLGSLRRTIDMDALNLALRQRTPSPPLPAPMRYLRNVEPKVEQPYDQHSVTTLDYASSHKSTASTKSAKSVAKPRMGKMKLVGTPDPSLDDVIIGDARYVAGTAPEPNPDIPLVDFGPTHAYSPGTRRPSTGDTLTLLTQNKNSSETALNNRNNKRTSWFGMENKPAKSPGFDEKRRSFLWQPGMVDNGRQSPGPGLTPEQFVEQRATSGSRGASPVYNHQRSGSRPSIPSRPASGDWANQLKMQQMPPRPNSRGSTVMLNQPDMTTYLSAREQEHVARVTGSPFFNMDRDTSKRSSVALGTGLVSAIDARERERQAMRDGVSGQMVQQAIMQRQFQGQFPPQSQQQMLPSSASQYQMPMNQNPTGTTAASVYNFPARANAPSRYHRFSKSQDRLQFMK
ncbi:hypothetical protein LOZ58_005317 [Ophidiomyces ophidiicola]|nr:hypothetical protein LOZ58_005317 [Ophidiomyces ophidiicola]